MSQYLEFLRYIIMHVLWSILNISSFSSQAYKFPGFTNHVNVSVDWFTLRLRCMDTPCFFPQFYKDDRLDMASWGLLLKERISPFPKQYQMSILQAGSRSFGLF